MGLLFAAWLHGGACPYRTYNLLDERFRPLERPDSAPIPPPVPTRLRNVLYGFALAAERRRRDELGMTAATSAAGMPVGGRR